VSQRLFFNILFVAALSPPPSSAWADNLPPYFSMLELSPEQSEALAHLTEDHSAVPTESLSPETERVFFTGCWKILTDQQRTTWNKAARVNLALRKEWSALDITEEQKDLLARPCALFLPRIEQANRDLRRFTESIEDTRKKMSPNDVGRLRELQETMYDLVKRTRKVADARKVWERALDSDMRECLTNEQNMQLLVIEAKQLLPKKYALLQLSDGQMAELAPKLKVIVPSIDALKAELSRLARKNTNDIGLGFRESLVKLEAELSGAVASILTDAQRMKLNESEAVEDKTENGRSR
jgi:hypothetical protein